MCGHLITRKYGITQKLLTAKVSSSQRLQEQAPEA